jgi:hypothetical protein
MHLWKYNKFTNIPQTTNILKNSLEWLQTLKSTNLNIEYEIIVPFQFHMKSSTHMISQKDMN